MPTESTCQGSAKHTTGRRPWRSIIYTVSPHATRHRRAGSQGGYS
jgi:hypothetical protein